MSDPLKIVFGVLSTHERNGWHHPSITQFFSELPFNKGVAYRMIPLHNFIPAANARNFFCKQLKDSDADWLAMVDNDMKLPLELLDTLKDAPADASIVVPTFYMWGQDTLKLTLCWGREDVPSGEMYGKFEPGFHELIKCGTGVIFIKPEVFHKLEYPYFRYVYDSDGAMKGTEDIQFCKAAIEAGFKIYGNSRIHVGHMHSVDLGSMWQWFENSLASKQKAAIQFRQQDAESSSARSAEACSAKA